MNDSEGEVNDSSDSEMSLTSWDNMSVDALGKNCFYFYSISIQQCFNKLSSFKCIKDIGEESDSSSEDISMQESNTNDSASNSTVIIIYYY